MTASFHPLPFSALRRANTERQRLFNTGRSPSLIYRANELIGEIGEACNVLKKFERERYVIPGSRATTQDFAEEISDVVICVDLTLSTANLSIEEIVFSRLNDLFFENERSYSSSEDIGFQHLRTYTKRWMRESVIENDDYLSFCGLVLAQHLGKVCELVEELEEYKLPSGDPNVRLSQRQQYEYENIQRHLGAMLCDIIFACDTVSCALKIDLSDAVQRKFNAASLKYESPVYLGRIENP